jgi:hypothetical protein
MKTPLLLIGLFSLQLVGISQAADIELKVVRKKLEDEKEATKGMATAHDGDRVDFYKKERSQKVAYTFTITNRTFQDLEPVTLKYMIFYKDEKPGSTAKPTELSVAGSVTTEALKRNGGQSTVDTVPVELQSTELPPSVRYTTGAKQIAKDRITGVWVRVYAADGTLMLDQPNPTTLAKKHEWKE